MKAIVGMFLVLACVTQAAAGEKITGQARVVDGDTLDVGAVRVRLKGIDASELGTVRGEAARRAMEKIVGGSPLTCDLTGEKTRRREVGFCFNEDGDDVAELLIAEGLALACPRYSTKYVSVEKPEALAAQERARYCFRGRRDQ